MDHETFREMLARRAELSAQEEAAVRAHLTDCLDCRKRAVAYARQTALLRSLPEADPPPALRAGVLSTIRHRPVSSTIPVWRRPMALVPVAAALLVAGIGAGVLRPASSGHPTAFGVATTTRVTSTMGPQVNRVKLKAQPASPAPSHARTSRALRHAAPHVSPPVQPEATPVHDVPVSGVAENPPGTISQAPPTRPAPSSTPTPLPSVLHVAAGAPPTSGRDTGVQKGAAANPKGSPPGSNPVAGGTAPSHPPRHVSPPGSAASSQSPVPTSLPMPIPAPVARTPTPPVPTADPYATAPIARVLAPVRPTATVTGTPTATPPPTATPFGLPYGGPLITPTPTP